MNKTDLVTVVEAAYDVEATDDAAWIERLVHAIGPLVPKGLGTNAFLYDTNVHPIRIWAMCSVDSLLDPEVLAMALKTSTPEYIENSWKKIACGTASEVPGYDDLPGVKMFFHPKGIRDVFQINAYNPNGQGCSIGTSLPQKRELSDKTRAHWTRVARHIATGFRLRLRLKATDEEPDAVLTPDGKTVHAQNAAKLARAREALKGATKAIEKARGPMRKKDSDRALANWRALVSAQWSLVDRFESDGKRYVLARANEPLPAAEDLFTPRERQVVALAAIGNHTKLIAYELGISDATVRVLLARAMQKAGAKSRDELLRSLAKKTSKSPTEKR